MNKIERIREDILNIIKNAPYTISHIDAVEKVIARITPYLSHGITYGEALTWWTAISDDDKKEEFITKGKIFGLIVDPDKQEDQQPITVTEKEKLITWIQETYLITCDEAIDLYRYIESHKAIPPESESLVEARKWYAFIRNSYISIDLITCHKYIDQLETRVKQLEAK